MGYNFHYGNPFSTYGENIFLLFEGIIILFLIKKYNKILTNFRFWISQIFNGVFSGMLFMDLVPEAIHELSILINIFFRNF